MSEKNLENYDLIHKVLDNAIEQLKGNKSKDVQLVYAFLLSLKGNCLLGMDGLIQASMLNYQLTLSMRELIAQSQEQQTNINQRVAGSISNAIGFVNTK